MERMLGEVLVARQPIVDTQLSIVGYELRYQPTDASAPEASSARATASVLVDGLLALGREIVTDGEDAYLQVPVSLLHAGTLLDLPSSHVVLGVPSDADASDDTWTALRRHRDVGFRLALDGLVPGDPRLPLVGLVDLVKVEIGRTDQDSELRFVRELCASGGTVAVSKVEEPSAFDRFVGAGATLVQGYFFTRPRAVRPVGLPPTHLALLRELALDEVDLDRIEELIRTDLTLTDRFLRLVDTLNGWREIESLRHGLVLMGTRRLHRWVTLFVMSAVAHDAPAELLTTASVRARYCEEIQVRRGQPTGLQAFGLGMFSVLGVAGLLDGRTVAELPLDEQTRAALGGEPGELRDVLDAALAAEQADWDSLVAAGRRLGLEPRTMAAAHVEALRWAAHAKPLAGAEVVSVR